MAIALTSILPTEPGHALLDLHQLHLRLICQPALTNAAAYTLVTSAVTKSHVPCSPPAGYYSAFSWDKYLEECRQESGAMAAPIAAFTAKQCQ